VGSIVPRRSASRARVASCFALALALELVAVCAARVSGTTAAPADRGQGLSSRTEVAFDKVVVAEPGDGGVASRLVADRIGVRRRTGVRGLVVYHDLREIFATGVELDRSIKAPDRSLLAHVVSTTKRLIPLQADRNRSAVGTWENALTNLRVAFTDLTIRLAGPGGASVGIKAAHGTLNAGSHVLVLEGTVVSMARGEPLHAPRAVFSDALDGVLLPLGYDSGQNQVRHAVFLVLDEAGRPVAAPRVPDLDYADVVDENEKLVLAHLLEHAPPTLQPMLALMAGGIGSGSLNP